jgi:hypothetical protein
MKFVACNGPDYPRIPALADNRAPERRR